MLQAMSVRGLVLHIAQHNVLKAASSSSVEVELRAICNLM